MGDVGDRERRYRWRDVAWYLAGVAGMSACLTLIFLGMRAVMAIGGACADGGPFVPVQRCPEGVGAAMAFAFPGLFLFGGVMLVKGSSLGDRFAALVALAWPALFLSLGWNFLEFAFSPPGGEGIEIGWLVCGIVFVLMGGLPLAAVVGGRRTTRRWRSETTWKPPVGAPAQPPPPVRRRRPSVGPVRRAELLRLDAAMRGLLAGRAGAAPASGPPVAAAPAAGDLLSQLERLAALHDRGALTDLEFRAAKQRLLGMAGER